MATPAQVAANRVNARASTGPRTPEGKAGSRYNALKHGLYTRDVTLPGEDRAAFEAIVTEFADEFQPDGRYERALVRRMADLWWRLGRLAAIETGLLNTDWEGRPGRYPASAGGPLVDAFRTAIDDTATLDKLGRYEARLERAFKSVASLMERRQERRRAGPPTQENNRPKQMRGPDGTAAGGD